MYRAVGGGGVIVGGTVNYVKYNTAYVASRIPVATYTVLCESSGVI